MTNGLLMHKQRLQISSSVLVTTNVTRVRYAPFSFPLLLLLLPVLLLFSSLGLSSSLTLIFSSSSSSSSSSTSQGVTANAVHPGGIHTGLQWNVPEEEQKASGWDEFNWKTIEQGAATSIWCAVATELEGKGGYYCEDCAISGPNVEKHRGCTAEALDEQEAERLWNLSEAAVKGEKSIQEIVTEVREKELAKKK
jgi:hypothetical protein